MWNSSRFSFLFPFHQTKHQCWSLFLILVTFIFILYCCQSNFLLFFVSLFGSFLQFNWFDSILKFFNLCWTVDFLIISFLPNEFLLLIESRWIFRKFFGFTQVFLSSKDFLLLIIPFLISMLYFLKKYYFQNLIEFFLLYLCVLFVIFVLMVWEFWNYYQVIHHFLKPDFELKIDQ